MCKTKGCNLPAVGKSAYCREHKREAYHRWKDIVSKDKAEREARNERFRELFARAERAGLEAGNLVEPTPMVVQEHANPLDDSSPVVEQWYVAGGVCGFAYVRIYPGNCRTANYARKHLGWRNAYHGGVSKSVRAFNQSIEPKIAYARAMATVLQEGLKDLDPKARVTFEYRED